MGGKNKKIFLTIVVILLVAGIGFSGWLNYTDVMTDADTHIVDTHIVDTMFDEYVGDLDKIMNNEILTFINTENNARNEKFRSELENNTHIDIEDNNIVFSDGTNYEGDMADSKIDGDGEIEYADGSVYKGSWSCGNFNGEGSFFLPERDDTTISFDGNFEDNIFADGTITIATSMFTAGFDVENKTITKAVYLETADEDEFIGTLNNGYFEGECQINYNGGDTYKGFLVKNQKSGKGKYSWANGDYYNGQWDNDKMSGYGEYFFTKTGGLLKGNFEDNKPTGTLEYELSGRTQKVNASDIK